MHNEVLQLFDLTGKRALITGGARHLGFDAASILAAAGADLVITSREKEQAKNSALELSEKYGIKAFGVDLDQTDVGSVSNAVDATIANLGGIDILINNAGGTPTANASKLIERQPQFIDELIRLNLTGTLYVCRAVSAVMAKQNSGKIINVASIAGIVGRDRRIYDDNGLMGQPIDYAAAKAGIIGATRDLAAYLGPMGINVNAISPGGFQRESMPDGFVKEYADKTILGRLGRDGVDLKGAILFLSSKASDYVTGQNLVVDGGFSVWK